MPFLEPPNQIAELQAWIKSYLCPSENRLAFRAHQFTINGVTYPFVRNFHFAAVPDPPKDRRHDMYAGLYLTRPGDLMYFFQADPQWDLINIDSRRGLRGIYRIVSRPFRDTSPIQDQNTGYRMLGSCPYCSTFHSTLKSSCPKCDQEYPGFSIPSRERPYFELMLSSRLDLEPLIIFERAVSDERVYADMSDPGMVWIGRHDNQMGPGKGSSIRQLMPEEAVKIARLMLNEPEQRMSVPAKALYPNQIQAMTNEDGSPAEHLKIHYKQRTGKHELWHEDSLNFHIARVFDNQSSSFCGTLRHALGGIPWDQLEYASSMFPWGYTAGTSDFVLAFHNGDFRYSIVVMELKKGIADDDAFLQASLYVPWCVQVLTQFAAVPPPEIRVLPVVIGRGLKSDVVKPSSYAYRAIFNSGVSVNVAVDSPRFFRYQPVDIYEHSGSHYARDIDYLDESQGLGQISWSPPPGMVTTQVERRWLLTGSWSAARQHERVF